MLSLLLVPFHFSLPPYKHKPPCSVVQYFSTFMELTHPVTTISGGMLKWCSDGKVGLDNSVRFNNGQFMSVSRSQMSVPISPLRDLPSSTALDVKHVSHHPGETMKGC